MSGSLASAKAKRAGIATSIPTPQPVPTVQGQPSQTKMTFQQVITVIDNRMTKLEEEIKKKAGQVTAQVPAQVQPKDQVTKSQMEEMENKFMMLAEEITTMKDVIMKLQTFTMEVNKTLFDERMQIMSDTGTIKTDDIERQPSMITETGI
jgi:hypothetical protein